jgi:hypothetical protein
VEDLGKFHGPGVAQFGGLPRDLLGENLVTMILSGHRARFNSQTQPGPPWWCSSGRVCIRRSGLEDIFVNIPLCFKRARTQCWQVIVSLCLMYTKWKTGTANLLMFSSRYPKLASFNVSCFESIKGVMHKVRPSRTPAELRTNIFR